jgi:hypothetical protein
MLMAMSKKGLLAAALFSVFLVSFQPFTQTHTVAFALENMEENSWTERAPMPIAGYLEGAEVVNGEIFALYGSLIYKYDPPSDSWTQEASVPTQRGSYGEAKYENKIYLIGGGQSINLAYGTNEAYDPTFGNWNSLAPMPTPRFDLRANIVGGKIYLAGGMRYLSSDPYSIVVLNTFEIYDISSNSWSDGPSMPTAVFGYASAVVGNKIYVIGGKSSLSYGYGQLDLVQIYDCESGTWSLGNSIPLPTYVGSACATTGEYAPKRIYVFGGCPQKDHSEGTSVNATQVYDPETNNWTFGADMPTARFGSAVANANDTLYVIGGRTGNHIQYKGTNVTEQYTPFGYVSPSSPSPFPSPSSTLSPSPSATLAPTSTQKAQSGFLGTNLPTEYGYAIVAALVIIVVAGLSLAYFKKLRK